MHTAMCDFFRLWRLSSCLKTGIPRVTMAYFQNGLPRGYPQKHLAKYSIYVLRLLTFGPATSPTANAS